MRARNIKPGFFINCELSEIDFASRLLFIGLWCYADREGRFEWKPKQIKAAIFPYDNVNIDKLLCNLMSLNVITCHDATGYIENFKKHQNPHPHEAKSVLPEKPEYNQCHDKPCNVTKCNADIMIPDSLIPDTRIQLKNTMSVSQAKADPIPFESIIESTNQILEKKFRVTAKHKTIIKSRWSEGYRQQDFEQVCNTMLAVWGNDPKMQAYLRPETLFGTKMDSYLNMKPISCNRQRSKSEEWRDDAQSEINAFINGRENAADNRQQAGLSQIRSGNAPAL